MPITHNSPDVDFNHVEVHAEAGQSEPRLIRRAVVTGGAGFLGSHLCEELLRFGCEVFCLDNFSTSSPANVADLSRSRRFHLLERDVTESIDIAGPIDLVAHLASPASPPDYLRLPIETLMAGSLGTLNTLRLATQKSARYLLASTSEIYGDPLEHPQKESYWGHVNPIGPRSVYDEAKRFSEAITTAYRTSENLDAVIVRIFNTYGPRMRSSDGRAVPTFIVQALSGRPLTVAGDGSQTRSFCYVDDTVRGILAAAYSAATGPFNIGNSEEVSILCLAEQIRELTNSSSSLDFVALPTDDPICRRPSTLLAEQLLNWRPRVTTNEGLRATVDWFQRDLL